MFGIAIAGVFVNLALMAVLQGASASGHGHSHGGLSGGAACAHGAHEADAEMGGVRRGAPHACGGAAHSHSHGGEAIAQASLPPPAPASHGHAHAGGPCGGHGPVTQPRAPAGENGGGEASGASGAGGSGGAPRDPRPSPPCDAFPDGALFFTRSSRLPATIAAMAAVQEAPHPPEDASQSPQSPPPPPRDGNINMRAAYLHVIGDLLQSIGVAVAGAIIWAKPALHLLDPLLTILFSGLVLFTTARLVREIVDIILERTPRHLDAKHISRQLAAVPGVVGVHDLHIWSLMPGKTCLTVHCRTLMTDTDRVLGSVQTLLAKLDIHHTTVQIERQA